MTAYLAAAAATPVEDCWTAGAAEVLIVQGLADVAAPVGNGRLLKQELGERGTLVELSGIGHAMPVENPLACAEAILDVSAEAWMSAMIGRRGFLAGSAQRWPPAYHGSAPNSAC